jgi:hypothetical protein
MPTPDVFVKFSADGANEGERYIEILLMPKAKKKEKND